ncbi:MULTISPECIES: FkbM family methyltransferase [unclassified Arthrobacter]|uniref:FkbM family methyltransferase n=1 Tax=unclassified Arthrobacter TaxID=235627 RepID=UPI00136494D8|nr:MULTISPECIES: FkbM family methyltransferase [unclassified Arthrobacter]
MAIVTEESISYCLSVPSAGDHIGKHLLSTGSFYESELLKALRRLVGAEDVVVDVGANIGNHTVYFAGVLRCKVIAVEPIPIIADILRRNVANNGLLNSVAVHQLALGASEGRAEIEMFDAANYGGTTLRVGENGDIQVTQLDTLISETVDLIKIDAEGMDYQVLLGAREIIENDMPAIVIEAMTDQALNEIDDFLAPLGYSIVGQYNATPTYVFLPMRTTEQVRRAIRFLGLSAANQQVLQRSQEATLRQVGRYAERLSTETYARIMKQIDEGETPAGSETTNARASEGNAAALERRLHNLEATLGSERTAFKKLTERFNEVACRAQRFEQDLSTRSQRMTDWRNLEMSATSGDLDNLMKSFLNEIGQPIQNAAEIVKNLQSENRLMKSAVEAAAQNEKQFTEQMRTLTVSRGEFGRQNRRLNKQLLDMSRALEHQRAENVKLRADANKKAQAPLYRWLLVPRNVLRNIKKRLALGGE